tara:strand:+ start:345 stop:872 length:528 start_codon:yes stop_codon:yes gene_type:complete
MIKLIFLILILPIKANAFISISNTIFSQEYEEYRVVEIENSLSVNLNYFYSINKSWLVGISTNRLTAQFLSQEGILIDKATNTAIRTRTKLTTDSLGFFRVVKSYLIGGNIINARKKADLYIRAEKIADSKESELIYGLSFGKIFNSGVLTATYIFGNKDFNLKRAINFSYAIKF